MTDQENQVENSENPAPETDAPAPESEAAEEAPAEAAAAPADVPVEEPAPVAAAVAAPAAHVHDAHGHGDGAHGGHGHGSSAHGGHGDDHFAHTTPMWLLLGVLGALIVLTVLTVGVTAVDLGSQGNFVVAMIIATIKAALVMAFFMHLVWDSKFNVVAFVSSFLFVLLFLSMSVLDRKEYQPGIDHFENAAKEAAQE